MKAVQIDAYGGPENMVLRDIATPEPGAGEALVRLEYAGVNYTDVYNRNGMYAKSNTYANSPPFTLGREGGGHRGERRTGRALGGARRSGRLVPSAGKLRRGRGGTRVAAGAGAGFG